MQFIDTLLHISPDLYQRWGKIAVNTHQADPFCCSPVWQFSFHEAFDPERRLLIEETSDCVIAFAETIFSPETIYLTPIEGLWYFGCPLLGKCAVGLLAEAISHCENVYTPFSPRILISGIQPHGALPRRLFRAFGESHNFFLHSTGIQCASSLHGGVDGFLSRRSANHRNKLKKSLRQAAEKGIYFERVLPASVAEAEATYSRMLAVELASWKGIGRCGMAEPPAARFYEVMLQRLAVSQEARVIFARHEDKDIGFIFGGKAGDIYRGQQFSYDELWKKYSVGNVLQMEQIIWLCEEGAKRYDMGPLNGTRMGYKSHWTEKNMEIQTWILEKK